MMVVNSATRVRNWIERNDARVYILLDKPAAGLSENELM